MKGQLNVKTPAEYLAAVDDKRRPDVAALGLHPLEERDLVPPELAQVPGDPRPRQLPNRPHPRFL